MHRLWKRILRALNGSFRRGASVFLNLHDDIVLSDLVLPGEQNVFNAINKAYIPLIGNNTQVECDGKQRKYVWVSRLSRKRLDYQSLCACCSGKT